LRASQSGRAREVLLPEMVYTETPFCSVTLRDMSGQGSAVVAGGRGCEGEYREFQQAHIFFPVVERLRSEISNANQIRIGLVHKPSDSRCAKLSLPVILRRGAVQNALEDAICSHVIGLST